MSSQATRHIQKFTNGFKKNRKPGIFKKSFKFRNSCEKTFSNNLVFKAMELSPLPPWVTQQRYGTHRHIAIALRCKTLIFIGHQSTATVQVAHCPLHPLSASASASKLTVLDSLPHHIDQSVQIELWLRPQLSCLLVLFHLKWQQCLWASWNFSLEKN